MKSNLQSCVLTFSLLARLLTLESCKKEEVVPTADFSFLENTNGLGLVDFTNHSSNAVSFLWEVDGIERSRDSSPSLTFDGNNTYVVSLTVTSSTGNPATVQKDVTITHGPYFTALKSLNSGNFFDFVSLKTTASRSSTMISITAQEADGSTFLITLPLNVQLGEYPGTPYDPNHDKDLSMLYTTSVDSYFGDLNYHFQVIITYLDAAQIRGTFGDDLLVNSSHVDHYAFQNGEFAVSIQ